MTTGCATIIRADARALPIADASVDLVVTSPPYWALRSYQDGGEHYASQIGSEATPAEWVDALIAVTRECMRVLKPTGSMWINLGDKYDSGTSTSRVNLGDRMADGRGTPAPKRVTVGRPKSLLGMPWRYTLRCVDDLGLILRAEVIWAKPNPLPEAVIDRVRRSHETWFHFTKQPRYFSAVDTIRQPYAAKTFTVGTSPRRSDDGSAGDRRNKWHTDNDVSRADMIHPLGSTPGSVWDIPSQPLSIPADLGTNHFAAFPVEWPRRIILGWSPSGICTECGEGRRPVVDRRQVYLGENSRHNSGLRDLVEPDSNGRGINGSAPRTRVEAAITGEVCACTEPTAPTRLSVVLDPFGGTGTTALAAKALGRHGISVDMSADYCRIAHWRTNDLGELAKAMRVAKPPAEVDGQGDLLDALGHW